MRSFFFIIMSHLTIYEPVPNHPTALFSLPDRSVSRGGFSFNFLPPVFCCLQVQDLSQGVTVPANELGANSRHSSHYICSIRRRLTKLSKRDNVSVLRRPTTRLSRLLLAVRLLQLSSSSSSSSSSVG